MKFRRVTGTRAAFVGGGTFLSILVTGVGYVDTAQRFLPPLIRTYSPLLMMAGFAAALVALGTIDEKDAEPALVLTFGHESNQDEETGEYYDSDYIVFRNVGQYAVTKIRLEPFDMGKHKVRLWQDVPALLPGEHARVSILGIGSAFDKIAKATRDLDAKARVVRIKLVIRCYDWKQREEHVLHYVLAGIGVGNVDIRRLHDSGAVSWTDPDKLRDWLSG